MAKRRETRASRPTTLASIRRSMCRMARAVEHDRVLELGALEADALADARVRPDERVDEDRAGPDPRRAADRRALHAARWDGSRRGRPRGSRRGGSGRCRSPGSAARRGRGGCPRAGSPRCWRSARRRRRAQGHLVPAVAQAGREPREIPVRRGAGRREGLGGEERGGRRAAATGEHDDGGLSARGELPHGGEQGGAGEPVARVQERRPLVSLGRGGEDPRLARGARHVEQLGVGPERGGHLVARHGIDGHEDAAGPASQAAAAACRTSAIPPTGRPNLVAPATWSASSSCSTEAARINPRTGGTHTQRRARPPLSSPAGLLGAGSEAGVGELEARLLAEVPGQAHLERLVAPRGLAAPALGDVDGEQRLVGVDVVGLELGEPVERRRGAGVVAAWRDRCGPSRAGRLAARWRSRSRSS